MPKILLVKTSSLGDVVHNLPVVTDIHAYIADATVDWIVEEPFTDIPAMHPGVNRVFSVAVRRWRKSFLSASNRAEILAFRKSVAATGYDFILDTQGLIKSALIARLASGERCGYAWDSAREPFASLFYSHTFHVEKGLHAVERNRALAAQSLHYHLDSPVDYGLRAKQMLLSWLPNRPYAVLLHATSRADKQWQTSRWLALGSHFNSIGITCILPWGSEAELAQSQRLSRDIAGSIVPPLLKISEIATLVAGARIVIGVDTGITHLAAALNVPVVAIFCASDPMLTGIYSSGPAVNLGRYGMPPEVSAVIASTERLLTA